MLLFILYLIPLSVLLSILLFMARGRRYILILHRSIPRTSMVQRIVIGRTWTQSGAEEWTSIINTHLGFEPSEHKIHVDWSKR